MGARYVLEMKRRSEGDFWGEFFPAHLFSWKKGGVRLLVFH